MKKLKVYLGVALFGAMSFGAFTAYDYVTMSEEERVILENIEALTSGEPGSDGRYYIGRFRTVGCGSMSMIDHIPYCCDDPSFINCTDQARACSERVYGCND